MARGCGGAGAPPGVTIGGYVREKRSQAKRRGKARDGLPALGFVLDFLKRSASRWS